MNFSAEEPCVCPQFVCNSWKRENRAVARSVSQRRPARWRGMRICRSCLGLLALLSLLHPAPGQPPDASDESSELDTFRRLGGHGLLHRSGGGASQAQVLEGKTQLRLTPSDRMALPWYGVGADWEEVVATAPWGQREGFACLRVGAVLVLIGGRVHTGNTITYMSDVWTSTDGVSWVLALPHLTHRE